jgi:hypothetical protein
MTPEQVVAELGRIGVTVAVRGGRFTLAAPQHRSGASGLVRAALAAAVREHKDEVLSLLGIPSEGCWVCDARVCPADGVVADCDPRRRVDVRAEQEWAGPGPIPVPPCPFGGER